MNTALVVTVLLVVAPCWTLVSVAAGAFLWHRASKGLPPIPKVFQGQVKIDNNKPAEPAKAPMRVLT